MSLRWRDFRTQSRAFCNREMSYHICIHSVPSSRFKSVRFNFLILLNMHYVFTVPPSGKIGNCPVAFLLRRWQVYPAGNYMFKVNNRNTRTRCEICSKLTISIPEQRNMFKVDNRNTRTRCEICWLRFGIFIANFEHISHLVLVFLILTLNM